MKNPFELPIYDQLCESDKKVQSVAVAAFFKKRGFGYGVAQVDGISSCAMPKDEWHEDAVNDIINRMVPDLDRAVSDMHNRRKAIAVAVARVCDAHDRIILETCAQAVFVPMDSPPTSEMVGAGVQYNEGVVTAKAITAGQAAANVDPAAYGVEVLYLPHQDYNAITGPHQMVFANRGEGSVEGMVGLLGGEHLVHMHITD